MKVAHRENFSGENGGVLWGFTWDDESNVTALISQDYEDWGFVDEEVATRVLQVLEQIAEERGKNS